MRTRLISFFVILIVLGVGYYIYSTQHTSSDVSVVEIVRQDPAGGLVVPEGIDEATANVYQHHIDTALALHTEKPEEEKGWILIGGAYKLIDKPDEAIAAYKIAAEINPTSILAYRNIAEVYRQDVKDFELAAQYYRLAITHNLIDATLYISLAQLLEHQLDRPADAEQVYISAIGPRNDAGILVALIDFYDRQGDIENQKKAANALLVQYPDVPQFQKFRSLIAE